MLCDIKAVPLEFFHLVFLVLIAEPVCLGSEVTVSCAQSVFLSCLLKKYLQLVFFIFAACPLTLFKFMPGKMSPSGTPQSRDKNTVDKCMDVCEKQENCVAMDFSTSLKQCWIFTRDVLEVVDSNGVDHYAKQPCRRETF